MYIQRKYTGNRKLVKMNTEVYKMYIHPPQLCRLQK